MATAAPPDDNASEPRLSGAAPRFSARRPLTGFGFSKWVALIALLAVFLGAAVALMDAFAAERQVRRQISRTYDIVTTLNAVMQSVLDAETGRRGYLLTGDESYLTTFEANRRQMPILLAKLAESVEGIRQETRQKRLALLHNLKLAELEKAVELTKSGQIQEARRIFDSDVSRAYFEELRAVIAALRQEEAFILRQRLNDAETIEDRTLLTLGVLGLIGVAIILTAMSIAWRSARLEADARDLSAVRAAQQRAELLARELNHRVKNLFSVILSIISMSARNETDVRAMTQKIRDRVHALAAAHAISQGQSERSDFSLRELVDATLEPYSRDGDHLEVSGPDIRLPTAAITPLGLALHELATNAAKYGAWSSASGTVELAWSIASGKTSGSNNTTKVLQLAWSERGGPKVSAPANTGFGTRMVQTALTQLNGTSKTQWDEQGLQVKIELQLPEPRAAAGGKT